MTYRFLPTCVNATRRTSPGSLPASPAGTAELGRPLLSPHLAAVHRPASRRRPSPADSATHHQDRRLDAAVAAGPAHRRSGGKKASCSASWWPSPRWPCTSTTAPSQPRRHRTTHPRGRAPLPNDTLNAITPHLAPAHHRRCGPPRTRLHRTYPSPRPRPVDLRLAPRLPPPSRTRWSPTPASPHPLTRVMPARRHRPHLPQTRSRPRLGQRRWHEQLAFRDRVRAEPAQAGELKARAADEHPGDREAPHRRRGGVGSPDPY